jgi:hypothetical protein
MSRSADVVVVVGEGIELDLQLWQRPGGCLAVQVALEGLVQALDLPAGLRVIWTGVLELDREERSRFCGWETIRPSRRRTRQIVEIEGIRSCPISLARW